MPAKLGVHTMTDLDSRRRRLIFRANHRGTKEADLMIGAFVQRHVAGLGEAELTALEDVLEHWDVDLADWLSGRRPVPEEYANPMLDRLIAECGAPGAGLPEHLRPADSALRASGPAAIGRQGEPASGTPSE
jgi:antitoxin CptB